MQARKGHTAFLALIAALCFAVLSGLHAARPIPPASILPTELASLGYTLDDICGYGDTGSGGSSCPNCTLAGGLALLAGPGLQDWTPVASKLDTLPDTPDLRHAAIAAAYHARAPPVFT